MHASLEQLIGLRDEEPVAVEVQQHVRGCSRCAAALNGLLAARERVQALADPVPPADAWRRILAASERSSRRRRWLPAAAGLAVAATVVGMVVSFGPHGPRPVDTTLATASQSLGQPADINQLMAQSRYLERAVYKLGGQSDDTAMSAGTASTIAALEDRIALIDYEIGTANQASKALASDHVKQLWQQRVDLLQSLAAVRYAQTANTGI
ncbi:MAG TPA: hypothetical protein VGH71_02435 [Gammaproteobacteria bacterium]|jgi:hypothetical protein